LVGRPELESRQVQKILLFSTASRPALGPTQPPTQWVPGAVSPEVRRQGCEADRLQQFTAEVKNGGVMPSLPNIFSQHGVSLIEYKGNCVFLHLLLEILNICTYVHMYYIYSDVLQYVTRQITSRRSWI
jgi:hypothetical protein